MISGGVMKDFVRATREQFHNVHFCGTESAVQWQGKNLWFWLETKSDNLSFIDGHLKNELIKFIWNI